MSNQKIIGVTVGTTRPRANLGQTDPKKSDYINNRPTAKTEAMTQPVGVDENGDLWTEPVENTEAVEAAQAAQRAAEAAKGEAEQKATDAGNAAQEAATAAENAEKAQAAAETAANTATSAKTAAESARDQANQSATNAANSAGTASAAAAAAEATKNEVEQKLANGYFDGEDGKSAYAYAQDGGYSGTEPEFANDLATIHAKVDKSYIVSVFGELKTALENADIDGAIAVLDQAILDMATLA